MAAIRLFLASDGCAVSLSVKQRYRIPACAAFRVRSWLPVSSLRIKFPVLPSIFVTLFSSGPKLWPLAFSAS